MNTMCKGLFNRRVGGGAVICAVLTFSCAAADATSAEHASQANLPSRNVFLADSHNAMAHNDPAQQDAQMLAGPSGPSRRLSDEEIQYLHTGPAHFGQVISGEYSDGKRVFWGNGIDRIVKVDYDTYELIDEYRRLDSEV